MFVTSAHAAQMGLKTVVQTAGKRILHEAGQLIMIAVGAAIAAVGLELFLVPNDILDGGVIGMSIIAAALTNWQMSLFIVLFNLPFIFIGFRKLGLKFTFHTLFGVLFLSLCTSYLHHFEPITDDLFLATVIGAVILGTGVGLVIRTGARWTEPRSSPSWSA